MLPGRATHIVAPVSYSPDPAPAQTRHLVDVFCKHCFASISVCVCMCVCGFLAGTLPAPFSPYTRPGTAQLLAAPSILIWLVGGQEEAGLDSRLRCCFSGLHVRTSRPRTNFSAALLFFWTARPNFQATH